MVGHKRSYPVYVVTDVTSLGSVLRSDFPSFAVNLADMASCECVPATVPPSKLKQPTPYPGVCGEIQRKSFRTTDRGSSRLHF